MTKLDECAGCGQRVTDYEFDGYEGDDAQRGHYGCDLVGLARDAREEATQWPKQQDRQNLLNLADLLEQVALAASIRRCSMDAAAVWVEQGRNILAAHRGGRRLIAAMAEPKVNRR